MKEYTKEELIGNILKCGNTHTNYYLSEPFDENADKIDLISVRGGFGNCLNYPLKIVIDQVKQGSWSIIPSKELQNTYEIY